MSRNGGRSSRSTAMTRLVYYVAQSLDGFIADEEGGVGFLDCVEEAGEDYGYHEFYEGVDSLVMGRATYDFVAAHGTWHYAGKPAWVLTSRPIEDPFDGVTVTSASPEAVLAEIRAAGLTSTWLVGGGRLAAAYLAAGLVDEWVVSVVPAVLGAGARLVPAAAGSLELTGQRTYPSGLCQLTYRTRRT